MSSFSYRVLLVDDNEIVCTVGKSLLEAQGYEVLCATDGFHALTAFKRSLPDIVISDLQMPHMNGFEFLSVVRKRFPQIPVIAISAEFTGRDVPESVLADAFFEKGAYTPTELFAKIISLLEDGPIRPLLGKTPKAAVWIPSATKEDYVAVTCLHCLRTFPVSLPLASGRHLATCDFCSTVVPFELSQGF